MTDEVLTGFEKRPASFHSDVLAAYLMIGPVSWHSGLPGEGVESTRTKEAIELLSQLTGNLVGSRSSPILKFCEEFLVSF